MLRQEEAKSESASSTVNPRAQLFTEDLLTAIDDFSCFNDRPIHLIEFVILLEQYLDHFNSPTIDMLKLKSLIQVTFENNFHHIEVQCFNTFMHNALHIGLPFLEKSETMPAQVMQKLRKIFASFFFQRGMQQLPYTVDDLEKMSHSTFRKKLSLRVASVYPLQNQKTYSIQHSHVNDKPIRDFANDLTDNAEGYASFRATIATAENKKMDASNIQLSFVESLKDCHASSKITEDLPLIAEPPTRIAPEEYIQTIHPKKGGTVVEHWVYAKTLALTVLNNTNSVKEATKTFLWSMRQCQQTSLRIGEFADQLPASTTALLKADSEETFRSAIASYTFYDIEFKSPAEYCEYNNTVSNPSPEMTDAHTRSQIKSLLERMNYVYRSPSDMLLNLIQLNSHKDKIIEKTLSLFKKPTDVTINRLDQYLDEYFTKSECEFERQPIEVEMAELLQKINLFFADKIVVLRKDNALIHLFSAFFSLFRNYYFLLSNELQAKLKLINVWEEKRVESANYLTIEIPNNGYMDDQYNGFYHLGKVKDAIPRIQLDKLIQEMLAILKTEDSPLHRIKNSFQILVTLKECVPTEVWNTVIEIIVKNPQFYIDKSVINDFPNCLDTIPRYVAANLIPPMLTILTEEHKNRRKIICAATVLLILNEQPAIAIDKLINTLTVRAYENDEYKKIVDASLLLIQYKSLISAPQQTLITAIVNSMFALDPNKIFNTQTTLYFLAVLQNLMQLEPSERQEALQKELVNKLVYIVLDYVEYHRPIDKIVGMACKLLDNSNPSLKARHAFYNRLVSMYGQGYNNRDRDLQLSVVLAHLKKFAPKENFSAGDYPFEHANGSIEPSGSGIVDIKSINKKITDDLTSYLYRDYHQQNGPVTPKLIFEALAFDPTFFPAESRDDIISGLIKKALWSEDVSIAKTVYSWIDQMTYDERVLFLAALSKENSTACSAYFLYAQELQTTALHNDHACPLIQSSLDELRKNEYAASTDVISIIMSYLVPAPNLSFWKKKITPEQEAAASSQPSRGLSFHGKSG